MCLFSQSRHSGIQTSIIFPIFHLFFPWFVSNIKLAAFELCTIYLHALPSPYCLSSCISFLMLTFPLLSAIFPFPPFLTPQGSAFTLHVPFVFMPLLPYIFLQQFLLLDIYISTLFPFSSFCNTLQPLNHVPIFFMYLLKTLHFKFVIRSP